MAGWVRQVRLAMAAIAASSVVVALCGCQATGGTQADWPLAPAHVRTGGGSIPDGVPVVGTVVEYKLLTGVPSDASSPSYMPVSGVDVTIADATGAIEVTNTSDGFLPDGGYDPLPAGGFVFADANPGRSRLTFDINGDSNATEAYVSVKGDERCEVIAGLVSDGSVAPDGLNAKVRASCDEKRVPPGSEPVLVCATIEHLRNAWPEIVWVMQTATDATLVPGSRPNEVLVVPGALEGKVRVYAYLEDARSNGVGIAIRAN